MKAVTLDGARAERELVDFRNWLRVGASSLALGGLLASQGAWAQDRPQTTEIDDAGEREQGAEPTVVDDNVIVVSGIRQSLANSQDLKRDADTVVDAITAEDIGALPDRSVTEALQRVPGIAINRFAGSNDPDHFSVEGSGVVVRGLNFVRSEFNGRTAFAAGVGGQALNFADVPSELLGSVIISKNATAEMIEGGLAGTVNLNTRKPFDRDGFHVGFSLEANYGDFSEEWTPTGSLLLSNTWDTEIGRFGILVSGSYSQIKARADGLQVANYQTRDGILVNAANTDGVQVCRNPLPSSDDTQTLPPGGAMCGNFGSAGADGFADYAQFRVAPVGGQFRTQDFNRKRDGFAVSAQFESIDERFLMTAEFIRSHSTNRWGEYTYETAPDLAEYSTYPIGCQQNEAGPNIVNADGTLGDPTARAQCPVGSFTDYVYDERNVFQSGYIVNASNGWRGAVNDGTSPYVPIGGLQQSLARREVDDEVTNEDYSLNMRMELTDRLTAEFDAHYATSRKQNLDFSVFGSTFADQELDLTGDYPVIIPHKPQFLGYTWSAPSPELGGATEQEYFTDPRFQFWRAAMDHIEDSEGDQSALAADLQYELDEYAFLRRIKFGARYQDRDQTVRYTTYNWGMLSETWSGQRPVNFDDVGNSERYEFPNFFRGEVPGPPGAFYYSGNLIDDYQESVEFFQSIQNLYSTQFGGAPTWNPLSQRPGTISGSPYLPADIQPVQQTDTAAYLQLDFGSDTLFGDIRFAGNIGVRYVNTDLTSGGSIGVPSTAALNIADPYSVRCQAVVPPNSPPGTPPQTPGGVCLLGPTAYAELQTFAGDGVTVPNTADHTYDYFLPSLNMRFGLTDDLIFRLAGSKVLTRPENSYIRNFLTIGLGTSGELTATAGNPFLLPATAWQFDASLEWYFAQVGSLTLNGFYKEVSNFFFQDITSRDITSNGITRNVLVRGPANFDGTGKIKGFELAYQQTYDFLPAPFDGFGVQANYTYIDSSGLPNTFLNTGAPVNESTVAPGNLPLEQLSKHNFNVTAFYEKGPISLRGAYNWRSRFLLTASDVIFPYYSIFNEPTGQLDASLFFNVSDAFDLPGGVRIGVQAVNLLNEVTETSQAYSGDPDQLVPRSFFMNDRRFSFIIRGNF
ncbi:TonB-dependent receptor [Aurantiacibacter hainanensis]|uniref:TonB-dependent receptor n=1 Tax=Aurantiacibacter hainanensis TaxID=3076114 RepID=UPI0030C78316